MSITYPLPTSSPRTARRGSFHAGRGEVRFKSPYANNAVTSITHSNSSGTQIVKHSYAYDSTNNIVEYLNSLDGNTTYDYDFLGQLISADYANATITDESYTYDSNGNRITANGDEYTTGTNNELTSDSNWTYTYDDEGNRISKTNSTNRELYEWDYRNRLTSVTQQEFNAETQEWTTVQIVEYTYDYNNVWIRKVLDSNGDGTADSKTIFIPENYQTVIQIDNGTISHHYLWTPETQDKLLADTTADGVLWSLTDHLGTVRDVVQQTSTGLVVPAHIIYDAYGNVVSCTNFEGETISNPILFGYTGKAFDTSTQLQNNINRWYDSTVGRWLSTDPIGFEGNDTNLYRYVDNQVLLFFDTYGHESIKEQLDKAIEKIDQKLSPLYCPTCSKQFGITCKIKGEGVVTGKATLNLGGIMGLKTTIAIYQDDANLWSFDDIRKLFNKQYNGTVESAKKVFKADCGQKKIHYLNQNTNRNQPASITQKKSWTEQRHKTFLLIRREQGGIVTKEIKEVDIVIRTRAYATVTYTLTFTVEASLRAYHCC